MLRRLLFAGLLGYVIVKLTQTRRQFPAEAQQDENAKANWDSEGGRPSPTPVDAEIMT